MATDQDRAASKRWYDKNIERARKNKREAMRRYRKERPEKYREHSRRAKKKLTDAVHAKYGRECSCCGFADRRALTLDHILNNGAQERKELGERGVYRRAIEKYRPREYRILCMNCQFIKRVEARRQNQHG